MLPAKSNPEFYKASIYLEGWGLPVDEVSTLADRLNDILPYFHWHTGDAPLSEALVLHLVDVAVLTGDLGHAFWNTFGPVHAMRAARQEGRLAMAVCRGRVSNLPVQREGVWVSAGSSAWESKLSTLARALAAMEWTSHRGYQNMRGWSAVRVLANIDLMAVTLADGCSADFSSLLRQVTTASLMSPVALSVAGVPRATFDRTLLEAGMQGIEVAAVAPMTLDGVMRADGLVGFPWPRVDQLSSSSNSP